METVIGSLQILAGVAILVWVLRGGVDTLLAPAIALVKDAMRYRRLRTSYMEIEFVSNRKAYSITSYDSTEDDARKLDETVDAAFAAKP